MYQNDSGDACCTECFQLGTKQRFVAKVSLFVWSMDMARLLHLKMFDSDSVPAFESKLRGSPNYLRRNKALYEQFMDLDLKELHGGLGMDVLQIRAQRPLNCSWPCTSLPVSMWNLGRA